MAPLRIGFVPEHFSAPLHFARDHYGLDAELLPFPSGTGHMITAIRSGEIDVAIGLTEGWIAGLGKEGIEGDGGYRLVGTYVDTPLCWAISTGASRPTITSVSSLRSSKIGVSRLGSGSQIMGFVLADQQGWLAPFPDAPSAAAASPSAAAPLTSPFAETVVLHNFANLRAAVNDGAADFFMWEHFTSKKYHDAGEIRRVGDIYTPWSSWKIVASTALAPPGPPGAAAAPLDPRLKDLFAKLDQGVAHFENNLDEAVRWITANLDYSEADARAWLQTVKFTHGVEGVKPEVVSGCVDILRKAGVLVEGKGMKPEDMVARD